MRDDNDTTDDTLSLAERVRTAHALIKRSFAEAMDDTDGDAEAAADRVRERVDAALSPEQRDALASGLESLARELGWDGRPLGRGRRGFGRRGFGRRGHGFGPWGFGPHGRDFAPHGHHGFGPHGHGFGPHGHGFAPQGVGFDRPGWASPDDTAFERGFAAGFERGREATASPSA
jgi:hypothetical protein